jgi:hypothetical protein
MRDSPLVIQRILRGVTRRVSRSATSSLDGERSAVLCAWVSLRHSVTAIAKEIRASCQRQIAHKPSFGLDIDWAFVDKYTIL